MSTVILFITLIAIIAIFAVLFACYQSQQRAREQRAAAQDQQSTERHAAIIYSQPSYPPQGPYNNRPTPRRMHHKMPTPAPITRNLPCLSYDPTTMGPGDKEDPPTCVICCCEYEQGDELKLLPCLHSYHAECIDAWLQRDHICPVCQADVILAAGLSLRDWSSHTCHAINMLSGSAAAAAAAAGHRPGSPPPGYAAATAAESGNNASVHQPATPTARLATPAAAASAGGTAATVMAVEEPDDIEPQAVQLVVMPHQQQQRPLQHNQVVSGSSAMALSSGDVSSSNTSSTVAQSLMEGSCIISRPSWMDVNATSSQSRTWLSSNPVSWADAASAAAVSESAAGSISGTSIPPSPSTPAAASPAVCHPAAAASAAGIGTEAPPHVIVNIPATDAANSC